MSLLSLTKEVKPAAVKKLNYRRAYSYWYARLADYIVSLFDWQGLPFKQHELEMRMQLTKQGYTGVVYSDKLDKWIVAHGSGVGVTEYPDKWLTYTWACPLASGINRIGENVVIFRNNSLMISSAFMLEHYAHLLAHNDLSMQAQLINARATGFTVTYDDNGRKQMQHFYELLEDGSTEIIMSDEQLMQAPGSDPIKFTPIAGSSQNILDFWQVGQNILKEFFATIGISKETDKRERLIDSEVKQELPLYQFNIEDMLDVRKEAAAELSRLMGSRVTVDLAESLKKAQNLGETQSAGTASRGGAENDN